MKKFLMLGSSRDSIEMLNYAKANGYYTIVTDYFLPKNSLAKQYCDESWMISTADIDALEQKCREEGINAIAEGWSQFNRQTMIELCDRLNLPCYISRESCDYEHDKAAFKRACKNVGALVADDYYVSENLTEEELSKIIYPVMVKPVDGSGNCGVSYCYDADDLKKAYHLVRKVSDNPNTIIEKMIEGVEYTAFYALANGDVRFLDLERSIGVEGRPNNCYVLIDTNCDCIEEYLATTNSYAVSLLKHIGCREGIAWIQFMKENHGPFYMIEMGYRLGGDCTHTAFHRRHGLHAVQWMTNCAMGIPNDLKILECEKSSGLKKWSMGYLLWSKSCGKVSKIVGLEHVLQSNADVFVSNLVKIGFEVGPYTALMAIVLAYDTLDEVNNMIETVNKSVQILDENGENMLFYYTDLDKLKEILQ